MKKTINIVVALVLVIILGGCSLAKPEDDGNVVTDNEVKIEVGNASKSPSTETSETLETSEQVEPSDSSSGNEASTKEENLLVDHEASIVLESYESSLIDVAEMFTDRDLSQEANLTEASYIELTSDESVTITEEGIYVLSGDVKNAGVIVEADDEAKIQLVLDGVTISNESAPGIYVKSADKVFVTLSQSVNFMEVTGSYEANGDTNLDAVIFSKSDLVFNGLGELTIISYEGNGITSKDDLKFTGGSYQISSMLDSIEANDSIRVYDGQFTIVTNKDGLHSENEDDLSLGYIYIYNGVFEISAADDAIHGTSVVQIDGGTIVIPTSSEGIEGNYVLINGGDIDIYATDDGINATSSGHLDVMIEVNGGDIAIDMASGDTDGFDANGSIVVNGGHIEVNAVSSFDADNSAILNGGVVVVNGETVDELPESRMGRRQR